MSPPKPLSDTCPRDEQLIDFETEELPDNLSEGDIEELPARTDLDNLPERTCNSGFPRELPPRVGTKPDKGAYYNHKHALIVISDIESSPRARWHLAHRSIKASDLARMTIEFAGRTPERMIPLQQAAWDRFQAQEVFNIDKGDFSDVYVVRKFAGLFCEFFFFGSMVRLLQMEDVEKSNGVFNGRCIESVYIDENTPGNIDHENTTYIIEIQSSSEPNRKKRLTQYLSILLHQMIHAYMYLFSCRVRLCHRRYMHLGSDHGAAFQDIACELEIGARIFGLDLDLQRQLSFAAELSQLLPRVSSISDRNLEYWGFERKMIRKQRAEFLRNFKPVPKCWSLNIHHEKNLRGGES